MIHSVIQYVLLSLGLAAALVLFWSLKREIHRNAARNRKRMEELAQQWSAKDAPAVAAPETIYIPASPRSGLNITKRVQAMRMWRRKQDVSTIAAALGVTRREVELLIRVQNLSAQATRAAARG